MAALTFVYPTSAEITEIAQKKMPRLTQDRPCFDFSPIRTVDEFMLLLEQLDDFTGLMDPRGLSAEPVPVASVGLSQYQIMPGTYGNFIAMTEMELTTRRAAGTFGDAIDISDLVMQKQDQLLERRLNRIEWLLWTVYCTGTFSVTNPNGVVVHQDAFPVQQYTAPIAWSSFSTAGPLADFSAVQLKSRGYSVDFGYAATAYMNRGTWNNMRSNANATDLYGRRTAGFGTINDIGGYNQLAQADDLPKVWIYDQTWKDVAGVSHTYIPDNTVVIIGKRPAGQPIGEFRFTRNVNNSDGAPGPYMRVIDEGEIKIPRRISVHDGFNGGPVINYPTAVCVMAV